MKFVELQDILLQNCSSKHEGLVVKSSEGQKWGKLFYDFFLEFYQNRGLICGSECTSVRLCKL